MTLPERTKFSSGISLLSEICASIRIIGLSIASACVFGIVNDQITIRICFEYFSEGFHKNIVCGSWIEEILGRYPGNCTVWAITWGIIASWWVGAILGMILSISSRVGSWPRLSSKKLIFPVYLCISFSGLTVFLITLFKYYFGEDIPATEIPRRLSEHQFHISDYDPSLHEKMGRNYLLCSFIHGLAYTIGFLYGTITVIWSIYKRYRLKTKSKE